VIALFKLTRYRVWVADVTSRNGVYGMSGVGHSGLMPANFTTLAHFSMSSAMNLPNSADELANDAQPKFADSDLSCEPE
jgi:hypothetical protein